MLTLTSILLALTLSVSASPVYNSTLDARASDCTGTISSLNDVSSAVKCTTVVINVFTVPAGKTFELKLASGTHVTLSAYFAVDIL